MPPARPDILGRRLHDLLQGLLQRRTVEHAIVAVERGDGFRWSGAAGSADPSGSPMLTETPFFIASVTKLFTATAVLRLAERRLLALDEPIRAYLPTELVDGLHRMDGVDRTDRITVRHLLGHTSGLADYVEERPKGGRSLVDQLVEDGDRAWEIEDAVRIVRERLGPHFPPQSLDGARPRARYSDTNYVLLIAIVEAVTGTSQQDAFSDLLFEPLGLRHTWLPPRSTDPPPGVATLWFKSQPFVRPLALRSFRDLYSTAEDLLAFQRALALGTIFDDPATRDLMGRRWIRFGFPKDRAALRLPSWPIQYGLGTMRFTFTLPRVSTPSGRQPTLTGHTGSTGSWLFHSPELDLVVAGTVDQATAGALPFRFVPKLLKALAATEA